MKQAAPRWEQKPKSYRKALRRLSEVVQVMDTRKRVSSAIDLTLKGNRLTCLQLALIDPEIDDLSMPYFVDVTLFRMLKDVDLLEGIRRDGKVFYSRNN